MKGFEGFLVGSEDLPMRSEGLTEGSKARRRRLRFWGDRGMYRLMDGWNFSPIYRTLSPDRPLLKKHSFATVSAVKTLPKRRVDLRDHKFFPYAHPW